MAMALVAVSGMIACTSELMLSPAPIPAPSPTPTHGLLLPDLKAEPPDEIYIRANAGTGQRELWFSTTVANIGDGPLEMIGVYDEKMNKTRAIQRIKTEQGAFEETVVGYFVFHESHNHWHFENFSELEIFSLAPDGSPAGLMGTTGKMTFCLLDTVRLPLPPPDTPETAIYSGCDPVIQGLSVGWADIYSSTLPGQQLNIENLPDDRYMIRITADPSGLILEKDESNNSFVIYVEIRGMQINLIDPPK